MKFFDLTTFLLTFLSREICPENIAVQLGSGGYTQENSKWVGCLKFRT